METIELNKRCKKWRDNGKMNPDWIINENMVGTFMPINITSEIVDISFEGSQLWNQRELFDKQNGTYTNEKLYAIECILNARKQVVAGSLYELNVIIGETECKKDQIANLTSCRILKSGKRYNCLLKIIVPLPVYQLPKDLFSSDECIEESGLMDTCKLFFLLMNFY